MKNRKLSFNFNWALLLILIILFVTISVINTNFLSPEYLTAVVLKNIVEIGLMALPVTLIVITGGIDLSVGSILVLSAMTGGIAAVNFGSGVGVLVTLLTGLSCGFINGVLVAKLKISPLVTTLATMYLYLGLARSFSGGDSIYAFPAATALGTTDLGMIPLQIPIYIIFAIIFWLVLSKSILGRKLYAIGLNENATRFSGIDTAKIKLLLYLASGLISALAALIWLGRFSSIKYDAGTSLNLKVVTIIVLGGTSILGGMGDIKGAILATLIIAVLNSGLTVLNIPIDVQTLVHGSVLVISLLSYSIINRQVGRNPLLNRKVVKNQS